MIAVRSNCDRGVIEPRSWIFRRGITSTISNDIHWRINIKINSRSWPDHGAIMALLKQDCGSIHGQSGSHNAAPRNRSHDPCKSLPRPLQLPTIFGLIFPLKTHVFLLCSSNFDRFVKEISKFRGRSLVHRDPPAFRLDYEDIGAGLITNFSLISSNFPLEFRTSTRKNLSKFALIHEN